MKTKTLALSILITTLCMASCGSARNSTTDNDMTVVAGLTDNNEVEKTLNLGKFNGIESSVIVDIHYTQGSKRNVRMRTSKEQIDRYDISVNGSTLVLKKKDNKSGSGRGSKEDKITLYVTAPDINFIDNRGIMKFYTKLIGSGGLQIRNKGILDMNIQNVHGKGSSTLSIENSGRMTAEMQAVDVRMFSLDNKGMLTFRSTGITGSLKLDNSGQLTFSGNVEGSTAELENKGVCNLTSAFSLTDDYSFSNGGQMSMSGDVKGTSATLKNTGVYRMEGSFRLNGGYIYDNSGQADNNGDVTAKTISMSNSGMDSRDGSLKADQLTMSVNGQSNYKMSFTGGDAKLKCSGMGEFRLALDCRSIEVNSNGQINVELSGTADKTSFDGSGISHLKTSRLNKF